MPSVNKSLLAIAAAILPCGAMAATTTTVFDFESGYVDNQEFRDDAVAGDETFLLDETGALSQVVSLKTKNANTMSIEETGGDDPVNGFRYDSKGGSPRVYDVVGDEETASDLGDFFLRTTSGLSGDFETFNPVFTFAFAGGASKVSGELWDIDGNVSQGSESWRVVATLAGGGTAFVDFPSFVTIDETVSLDAQSWRFEFDYAANRVLEIDFVFTGTKTSGIGAAFDNLTVTQTAPVPLPASAWMLVAALGGMSAMRRLRRG